MLAREHLYACGVLALSDLSSEVIQAPSGKALNDCEMLMQLIREAKNIEGRGLNKNGGLNGVRRRVKAKIKAAQGERKGMNQLHVSSSL